MSAPPGNQFAVKAKRWSQAIDRALANRSKAKGIEALDELAEKLLANAEQGDMAALKELGDRLEGKPAQAMTLANAEGEEFRVSRVERAIIDPDGK